MYHPTQEQRALLDGLPHSERDLLAAARAMEYRGDEESAIAFLGAAISRQPSDDMRAMRGNLLFRMGRFQDALITLIPILKSSPHHQQTLILVCECLIEVGEYARAQTLIGQARNTGVAAPVVANLQQLLTTRRMGLNSPSEGVDSTIDQSLIGADHLPLADAASTYQEPIDEATEHIDVDSAILAAYTSASPTYAPNIQQLPTMAASEPMDYPTMAAPPEILAKRIPSREEEPTKAFSRSATLGKLRDRARREHQEDIDQDRTFDQNAGHTQNHAFTPTGMLGREESEGLLEKMRNSARAPQLHIPADQTQRQSADAVPFKPAPKPPAAQSPDESMPMLGRPELAARFAMPDQSLEQSEFDPNLFGSPEDLHALANPDRPAQSSAPPAHNFHDFGSEPSEPMPQPYPPRQQPQHARPQAPQKRAFSEESLQLDTGHDANRRQPGFAAPSWPQEPQQQQQQQQPGVGSHSAPGWQQQQAPRNLSQQPQQASPARAPEGSQPMGEQRASTHRAAKVAMGGVIATAIALTTMVAIAYAADSSLMGQTDERTLAALSNMRHDTYEGRKAAYAQLEEALAQTSFLGAGADDMIATRLTFLPGLQGAEKKQQILGELAALAASMEYDYDGPGSFSASAHLERARAVLGEDHAHVLYAEAYAKMNDDPLGALAKAREARKKNASDPDLLHVYLDALLATHQPQSAWNAAAQIRENNTPTARQLKYLGRVAIAVKNPDAAASFTKVLAMGDGENIEAKMGLLHAGAPQKEAATLVAKVSAARKETDTYSECMRARIGHALAHHYISEGELSRARTLLMENQSLCPEHVRHGLALADFLGETGQRNAALKQVEELSKASENPLFEIARAKLALKGGEAREALTILSAVPSELPERAFLTGLAQLGIQDYTAAQKSFTESAKTEDPHGASSAYALLARLLAAPSRSAAISEEMEALLEKHPASTDVLLIDARIKAISARDASSNKKRRDIEAQSDKRFSEALASSDFDAPIYFERCRVFAQRGDLEKASKSCQQGHKLAQDYVPGEVTRASVMARMGKASEAISALEALDELTNKKNLTVRVALARTLILADRAESASKLVSELEESAPEDPRVILLLGVHAFHSEKYVLAYRTLKRAKDLAPTDPEVAVFFAYAQVRVGKLEEATPTLKKYLDDPVWGAYAWLALGELRRRQDRFKDTEENLEAAIRLLKGEMAPAWFITEAYLQRALAWSTREGWRDDRVATYLERAAREGNPNHVGLNYVRGIHALYKTRADQEAALRFFNLALENQPEHCPTLKVIPDTLRAQGEDERADALESRHKSNCSS